MMRMEIFRWTNRVLKSGLILFLAMIITHSLASQSIPKLLSNAEVAYEKGDYEKCVFYMEKALPKIKNKYGVYSEQYLTVISSLTEMTLFIKDFDKAIIYGSELKVIFELIREIDPPTFENNKITYISCLSVLAKCYLLTGQYKKAKVLSLESLRLQEAIPGAKGEMYTTTLGNLAVIYQSLCEVEKADSTYKELLIITEELTGTASYEYMSTCSNIGGFYQMQNNYDQAEFYLKKSLEINMGLTGKKHANYIFNLNSLANLYMLLGDYARSKKLTLEVLDLQKVVYGKDNQDYSTYLLTMTNLLMLEQDYISAKIYVQEAIGNYRTSHYSLGLISSLILLGDINLHLDDHVAAESCYLEAVQISNQVDQDPSELSFFLANLYQKTGRLEKADSSYIRSLEYREKIFGKDNRDYANMQTTYSIFKFGTHQIKEASQLFIQSSGTLLLDTRNNFLYLSDKERGHYLKLLNGNFEFYSSFVYQCRQQVKKDVGSYYDLRLGLNSLLLKSNVSFKKAIVYEEDEDVTTDYFTWKALKNRISIEYGKPLSKQSNELEGWEVEVNDMEKKLLKNSKIFTSNSNHPSIGWKDVQPFLQENEAVVEFVSFNYQNGFNLTDSVIYAAIVMRAKDTLPMYVPLFEENQLKGLLKGDSLRTFANLLYTDAQVRTQEHDISYGDSLRKLIWQPLDTLLKGISGIYYSPAGLLHNIAFDAIPANNTQLLSEKYMMHRLTSTEKMMDRDTGYFQPTSIAIFGGIQYDVDTASLRQMALVNNTNEQNTTPYIFRALSDTLHRGGSWSYLPGAKKETENIMDLFGKNKIATNMFTGQFGTEEEMKNLESKKSPSILHFSTHGFFFPDPVMKKTELENLAVTNKMAFMYAADPLLRSGLILAGANYVWKGGEPLDGVEDGILTSYEVSNLYLPNTKLVVMSACETGLGDIKGSEGVYGLQRAFKMAGVDYIIMTLWKVLDKETSDFMTLFYQNLLEKNSIPNAFKATQDTMKNKYRDEPYKWAGFVLMR